MHYLEDEPTRQFRDAFRLLFIVAYAGDPVSGDTPVPDAVTVVTSEKKLSKLDFWVRNPDHLAYALLDRFEETHNHQWLAAAEEILGTDEPEVRRDAMVKYLFGAYEPLDTGLAPLVSYGLVRKLRDPKSKMTEYFLLPKGRDIAVTMESEMAEAQWYSARAKLLREMCVGLSGDEIARIQYRQPEYAGAPKGETIACIAEFVRLRLLEIGAVHAQ